MANADVEIRGTDGILATGTTRSDGSFGPIEYSGAYQGALRVTASGNGSSTWVCDLVLGCPTDGSGVRFGETDTFDGSLQAVLPDATDGDVVSVSLLSNVVALRMNRIGGLSAENIEAANTEVVQSLTHSLRPLLDHLAIALPGDIAAVPLPDLNNLPEPSGTDEDRIGLTLSLVNSSMMGLLTADQTVGEYIDQFSAAFAAAPVLPIASPSLTEPSRERLSALLIGQVNAILVFGSPALVSDVDALLSPVTDVSGYLDFAASSFRTLPGLELFLGRMFVPINDQALIDGSFLRELVISTTDGNPIADGDYATRILSIEGGDWLTATAMPINQLPQVRLRFDTDAIAELANGTYYANVNTYSPSGSLRGHNLEIRLEVDVSGVLVDAGPDVTAAERSSVVLEGYTNRPNDIRNINWVQLDGPALTVEDELQPTVQLPSVDTDELAVLRLDINFVTGESLSDLVSINIAAARNIADVVFFDPTLQQCVNEAASAGGLVETIDLTSLTCPGVADLAGINEFLNLASLDLSGNSFLSLLPLVGLNDLEFLDISGNSGFRCDQVDALADRLEEGTTLLTDDTCQSTFELDLAAIGFDTASDGSREQIYVSLPDRNEIAVISTTELRIVDRIAVPGSPYGIDLSVDGTRLFAALNGSNAIAAIDLDQRSVTTIDVGDSTGHSLTYDVVEAEQDRLFVTASPGSSGFAYIGQITLNPALIGSRAANQQIIRARPTLAVSPDRQFVYVGAGFSPNSLFKLSLQDPDAGIVLEDNHGSVFGTDNLVLNATGTRIALSGGQVLRTGSFIEEGRVTSGPSASDGTTLYVASGSGMLDAFDFLSLDLVKQIDTGCTARLTSGLTVFGDDPSFMLQEGDIACIPGPVSRSGGPPDPLAALRLPDLALEECVVETAGDQGFTTPEEFTALDCSDTAKTILDLQDIDRFVNLQSLDISNSAVTDLSELPSLTLLETFVADNASLSDIAPLRTLLSLGSANLAGNPAMLCAELDQLVASGVTVSADVCTDTERVELGGLGHDLEYDAANDRVFVSIPSLNRVSTIDLDAASIVANYSVSAQPRGIDFSSDGVTLYAALNGNGEVAAIDTTNGDIDPIRIEAVLNESSTWDVAEVSPDRIVVSANPYSGGLSYIVEVRRDLNDTAKRVADARIIRAMPNFAVSSDQTAVYVGEGFSPNSVYKLDATDPNLPIIAEDNHGDVSGSANLAISPDGSKLYLLSGQVIDTDTIMQIGRFAAGLSTVSADGATLFVGDVAVDAARAFDTSTTGLVGRRAWGCDLLSLSSLVEFEDGIIAMGDDLVCFSRTVPYP